MTFQFAHMAPPGKAPCRATPFALWLRDAQSDRLVRRWHCPAQDDAARCADAQLTALVTRQAVLRAG